MDPEQTFIRVQERFSQMLRPEVRAALEYFYLFVAITLFSILVVMHANYVQQITSAGLWSQNESESNAIDFPNMETVKEKLEGANVDGDGLTFLSVKFWLNWIGSEARRDKLAWKFWKTDNELLEQQAEPSVSSQSPK